jgi:glycogen operon protein
MTVELWEEPGRRALQVFVNGEGIRERGPDGERLVDSTFLLLINAHDEPVTFTLPPEPYGVRWKKVIETAEPAPDAVVAVEAGALIPVPDRAIVVLDRAA